MICLTSLNQHHPLYPPLQVKIWDRATWDKPEVWDEEEGWKGPQLLKMAGLFSHWRSSEVRHFVVVPPKRGLPIVVSDSI